MKLILLTICLLFASSGVLTQGPPFNEVCETGKYPPSESTIAPTYQVDLDLPPAQRWTEITKQYAEPLRVLVAYLKQYIVDFNPKFEKLLPLVEGELGNIIDRLPQPYGEEIKGIAKDADLDLGDAVLYNIFYEIFTLCTSIVGQDPTGKIYHARNLDFGLFMGWDRENNTWIISELLRPLIINVDYYRNNELQYKTVTFVGFVGTITGMRPNSVSITMNERFKANGGYIGLFEWLTGINTNQNWVTFLSRDALDKGLNYEETVEFLATAPLLAPCYYIVGGPNELNGAVVTRDRSKAIDVWRLGTNDTWFLAQTNYDHWEKPLFLDDRITPANNCMNKYGQERLSFDSIFNVLSSKPVLNKLTVYSALMEPKSGKIETYIQKCEDPCWPWQNLFTSTKIKKLK